MLSAWPSHGWTEAASRSGRSTRIFGVTVLFHFVMALGSNAAGTVTSQTANDWAESQWPGEAEEHALFVPALCAFERRGEFTKKKKKNYSTQQRVAIPSSPTHNNRAGTHTEIAHEKQQQTQSETRRVTSRSETAIGSGPVHAGPGPGLAGTGGARRRRMERLLCIITSSHSWR